MFALICSSWPSRRSNTLLIVSVGSLVRRTSGGGLGNYSQPLEEQSQFISYSMQTLCVNSTSQNSAKSISNKNILISIQYYVLKHNQVIWVICEQSILTKIYLKVYFGLLMAVLVDL